MRRPLPNSGSAVSTIVSLGQTSVRDGIYNDAVPIRVQSPFARLAIVQMIHYWMHASTDQDQRDKKDDNPAISPHSLPGDFKRTGVITSSSCSTSCMRILQRPVNLVPSVRCLRNVRPVVLHVLSGHTRLLRLLGRRRVRAMVPILDVFDGLFLEFSRRSNVLISL